MTSRGASGIHGHLRRYRAIAGCYGRVQRRVHRPVRCSRPARWLGTSIRSAQWIMQLVTSGPVARPRHRRDRAPACRPGSRSTASGCSATSRAARPATAARRGRRSSRTTAEILGGMRHGQTLGGPLALIVAQPRPRELGRGDERLAGDATRSSRRSPRAAARKVVVPRPGHADLAGRPEVRARRRPQRAGARLGPRDLRARRRRRDREGPARRCSASRCTATWCGSAASRRRPRRTWPPADFARAATSEVGCLDPAAEAAMIAEIDAARRDQDTLGGIVEVRAFGCPPGLGSHTEPRLRLDARLGAAALGDPGHEGRRDRRRVRQRRPARLAGARRARLTTTSRSGAARTAPAASRAACRTASRSSSGSR